MRLSKKLLLLSVLIFTSLSCSFTNKMQKSLLLNRVFGTDDTAGSSPEILAEEILEDTLVWNCQANQSENTWVTTGRIILLICGPGSGSNIKWRRSQLHSVIFRF